MRLDEESFDKANKNPKMVLQYGLDGRFIRLWYSPNDAERELGIKGYCIRTQCNRVMDGTRNYRKVGGYQWRWATYEYPSQIEPIIPQN